MQAALGEDQRDTPSTVKSIMTVQVEVAAMQLQEGSGRLIMQAAMGGVDSRIVAYRETQDVTFSVSKVCILGSILVSTTPWCLSAEGTIWGVVLHALPCSNGYTG